MQRNETSEIDAEPSPTQVAVIASLMGGAGVTEAAERAGIARQTAWRWLKDDAVFVAAFNRAKRDQREGVRDALLAMATKAVNTLHAMLDPDADVPAGVRLKAALAVLMMAGANEPEEIGPTDPETIEGEWEHAETLRSLEIRLRRLPSEGDDEDDGDDGDD
jgi:hypothetical protein